MSEEVARLIGQPKFGGVLVVCDHASNRVPQDIDLGLAPELLDQHIAIDLGVAEVAGQMTLRPGIAGYLANVSRLVCDFNREEDSPTVVPQVSDGHAIPGNRLDRAGLTSRIERFYRPFHGGLARLLDKVPPALILSLHSFTPSLKSRPTEMRPWQVGVLYNLDDRAARLALPLLAKEGLIVGDQQPYSGRDLNATMNRHAEAEGRPYLGIEVRQDQISDTTAQALWADRLARIANEVALDLQ